LFSHEVHEGNTKSHEGNSELMEFEGISKGIMKECLKRSIGVWFILCIAFSCDAQRVSKSGKVYYDSIIYKSILEIDSTIPATRIGSIIRISKWVFSGDTTEITIRWIDFDELKAWIHSLKYLNMQYKKPIFSEFPFLSSEGRKNYNRTVKQLSQSEKPKKPINYEELDKGEYPYYDILFYKNKFVSRNWEIIYLPEVED
jgi:hypothetical protein